MIRIICSKCKNAYLQKEKGNLECPNCKAVFPEEEENLLLGAQYYYEGNLEEANNHLMKYIVKNGAEPRAIFYKALCDGASFDEDTVSLSETYTKILEALSDLNEDMFPHFLALANDEAEKLEKNIAEGHIKLFVDADAEKIKKEVSAIINLQNEAKDYRKELNSLVEKYNETAENKISVKLSDCFLVTPEIATEVGNLKFDKIIENIASHTVFTGILSTDIKNLEIYYRCIVMFFARNRQKYEFLMASAEKFTELHKTLSEGQYNTIKGVNSIGEKLKSAGYDFFQESLKDHDDEIETQQETVVILEKEVVEEPQEESKAAEPEKHEAEITEFEDIFSTTELSKVTEDENEASTEEAEVQKVEATEEVKEETVEKAVEEATESTTEEAIKGTAEPVEGEVSEKVNPSEDIIEVEKEEDSIIEIPAEEDTEAEAPSEEKEESLASTEEPKPQEENNEETPENKPQEENKEETPENNPKEEKTTPKEEVKTIDLQNIQKLDEDKTVKTPVKRKKSYGPILLLVFIVVAVIGLLALAILPDKLNAKNYEKAQSFYNNSEYSQAAEVFAKLGDYEDSEEKYKKSQYSYASQLEKAEKFTEAKDIYLSLGEYADCTSKVTSCIYNEARALLENEKYDEAIVKFQSVIDYADSKVQIQECTFKKASDLIVKKDYVTAIALLQSLEDYPASKDKILEAKYAYVKDNYKKDDETTVNYLKELQKAKYKDSADLRRKLLGIEDESKANATSVINYSKTDVKNDLKKATNEKPIYFHVTVNNSEYYNKSLIVQYTTSMGYTQSESIVLTKANNSYALIYPSTPSKNYSVKFRLLSSDNTLLATQTIDIE